MLFLKLIKESFSFAFDALRQNKLRTILSVIGITIGIMIIISVFSAVDTFRGKLQGSVDKLGSNTVYVQKWPWEFGGDYPWWKYMGRPQPSLRDYNKLKERLQTAEGVAYEVYLSSKLVKYKSYSVEGADIAAASHDYYKTRVFDFSEGRYCTEHESNGNAVAIIGASIAEGLFPNENPLDKSISVLGRKVKIIGVFKKEGEDMLGLSADKLILLPVNFVRGIVDIESDRYGPQITVKGKDNITITELESELKGAMRAIHRLSPQQDDDFSLNKSTILTAQLDVMFTVLNLAGLIIGGFSILIGGFSTANIMFVSVKERTNIIGIQKSLGAKNYFILLQFLIEAIALCLMGGLVGLAIVYSIFFAVKAIFDVTIIVDFGMIMVTIAISTTIGVLSGFIPAFMASKLDPVEAIRSK